jgi:hypothetical protein
MNEKLPAPCEPCKGTGLSYGSECTECGGQGYRLIVNGQTAPRPRWVEKPKRWQSRPPIRRQTTPTARMVDASPPGKRSRDPCIEDRPHLNLACSKLWAPATHQFHAGICRRTKQIDNVWHANVQQRMATDHPARSGICASR